jgi:hypothetical protein
MLISTMVIATQYAVTQIGYEYHIVHPSESDIRFIGSDNTSGGRVLRVDGANSSTAFLKLVFGNWSVGSKKTYSAAFGIVNEEDVALQIKYINVTSPNATYMRIWLHGNRTANANSTTNDPTTVEMFNNGTLVNTTDTTAWTLAPGDANSSSMCSNVSDRATYTINTPWDNTNHVRYSQNNTIAYSIGAFGRTISNASDYVWVQVAIELPNTVDDDGLHTGYIQIHFEADSD